MPADGDAQNQQTEDLQALVEETSAQAAQVRAVSRDIKLQGTGARERAAQAKQRELAAHQRAIELHERAADFQERLGHPDRAAKARRHAQHARELLAQGLAEQREQESGPPARPAGGR